MNFTFDSEYRPCLTCGQAAKSLNLSRQHVWRLAKRGTFRGVQVSRDGEHLIPTTEVRAYLKASLERERAAPAPRRVKLLAGAMHEK